MQKCRRVSSSGGTTTYKALPPPKQQQKFPNPRRSVKRKAATPKLSKDQSTLTQLDFVSTPNGTADVIPISSDDDFEEPRPKKKRKKSKFDEKERGQSTLTQMEIPSSSGRQIELDEDGFQIWEDYDLDGVTEDIAARQENRQRTLPWLQHEDAENTALPPEIPETSQNDIFPSPKADSGIKTMMRSKETVLRTPRKVHFTEVPSSQSPPSTNSSTYSAAGIVDTQRSPLKERCANVREVVAETQTSELQTQGGRVFDGVRYRTRKVPLNDTIDHAISSQRVIEQDEQHPIRTVSPKRPQRRFERVTTIQDSQAEDVEDVVTIIEDSPTKSMSSPKDLIEEQKAQSNEAHAVSDSDAIGDGQYSVAESPGYDYQSYADVDTQATFDPAASALDRDAARFRWTQTQTHQSLSHIREEVEDSETDDKDLDHGCAPSTARVIEAAAGRPSQSADGTECAPGIRDNGQSEHNLNEISVKVEVHEPAIQSNSAYGSGDHAVREEEAVVPSSPPTLGPAHVEEPTVEQVPSSPPLLQPSLVNTAQREQQWHHNYDTIEEASTIATSSPHKSQFALQQSLPSSPLLLPPWTSPTKSGAVDVTQSGNNSGEEPRLESLVDYSLPPPPPMSSSSRRATPT